MTPQLTDPKPVQSPPPAAGIRTRRTLLACGVAAGPLFITTTGIQILTRDGFDLTRHAISMLSLGPGGWIQIANFVICGLLALASAVGMRKALQRGKGRTMGPILVGVFGAGIVAAGVFTTDPAVGFPSGAPAGIPDPSVHSVLHQAAFFVLFVSLTSACVVFARRFGSLGQRRWAVYSVGTAVAIPILIALGMSSPTGPGVPFAITATVAWLWAAATAARVLADQQQEGT